MLRNVLRAMALCLAPFLSPSLLQAQSTDPGIIPGKILFMLTADGDPYQIAADLRLLDGMATGAHIVREVSAPMRIWRLDFDHTAIPQQKMLDAVVRHRFVMMAQNDHPVSFRVVPNDPSYSSQWQHPNINSPGAWDVTTGGLTAQGDTIVVCVLENSNLLHTDLVANRWLNHAEIPGNGIDDDGNGYVDDHRGWNPVSNNDAVYTGNNHGTQVAGMIGARGNNGVGVVGANWNVKIMVVEIGSLTQENVVQSYTYPLVMRRRYNQSNGAQGAFVVATNASWGIDQANPNNYPLWCAIYDTLGTAGILNCGATTNSNLNVDQVGDMPTACPSDFMVSVTATNSSNNRTFSGYGATTIDLGAPGSAVYTTSGSSTYGTATGTSFASPLTAGVIGLLYAAPCQSLMTLVKSNPQAGALYVRQKLFQGVDIVGNLQGQTVTGGRLNASNSMQLIMNECSPTVRANVKVWLQGAYVGPLMTDNLRTLSGFPLHEPYTALGFSGTGGEQINASVLTVTGNNAVVDWIRVELRNATTPSTVVARRHGLLQRDGDIVDTDGTSPLTFNVSAGNYHVAVFHRNHLGCMTASPVALSSTAATIDFRTSAMATWGTDARYANGSLRALWAGNARRDNVLSYTGTNNDRDVILQQIGGVVPTNTSAGYHITDVNMDGTVRYTGGSNDRDIILQNIGGVVPTQTRSQQVP